MKLSQSLTAVLSAITLTFAGAASAQDAAPQTVTITLTSYAYAPSMIDLKANVPVKLHLINNATKGRGPPLT